MTLVADNPLTLTVPGILAVAGEMAGASPLGIGHNRQGRAIVQRFEHQIHRASIPNRLREGKLL